MLDFFLRAHAWKLFALQFVLPIICLALCVAIGNEAMFEPIFVVTMLIWGGVVYLWMIAVARASNRVLSADRRRSTHLMETGLVFATVYALVALFVMRADLDWKAKLAPHLLAMFATIYAMWFTASRLSAAMDSSSAGTAGRFFLIWFFPLGIWFVQPDVRRSLGGVPA